MQDPAPMGPALIVALAPEPDLRDDDCMRRGLRLWCAMPLTLLACASQGRHAADLDDVDRSRVAPSARMQVDESALQESRADSMRELGDLADPEAKSRSEQRRAVEKVGTKNEARGAPPPPRQPDGARGAQPGSARDAQAPPGARPSSLTKTNGATRCHRAHQLTE